MSKQLTIPERLDWLLKQRSVSQNALARVSKVSPQTIANTLHHGRVPQARTTQRWARALGVPTSFFATRPMSEDQLLAVVEKAGSFSFSGSTPAKSTTRTTRTTTSSTTRKATPVTKTTTKKSPSAAKKTTVKSSAAKKATTTTRAASKPATKVAAKAKATTKAAAKPVAKKAVAKKVTAKKPVAKKAVAKRTTAAKVVRHGAVKRSTGTTRSAATNGSLGIDRTELLKKLVKLTSSKQDAVALDATKTLLTIVK